MLLDGSHGEPSLPEVGDGNATLPFSTVDLFGSLAAVSDSPSTNQPEQGSPWRVLVIALLATIAGSTVLAGFLLYPQFVGKSLKITERDRRVLIVAGDFEPWSPSLVIRNDKERLSKRRYGEDELAITYLYDANLEDRPIYVRSELRLYADEKSAAGRYREQAAAPLPLDRVTRAPKNDQFRWGDESEFGELLRDDQVVGRYFLGRAGDRVYRVTIFGVNTDFSSEFIALLTLTLDRAAVYRP